VLSFVNFEMKTRGIVYYDVVFPKSPFLLKLKLGIEICTSLNGRRFVASYVKG